MASTSEVPNETNEEPERLILVANRLPITLTKNNDASEYSFSISSGGLVTGLSGLQKTTKFKWYGWPGKTVPQEDIAEVEKGLAEKHDAIPIWVEPALMDLHYNKYCSK
jgi:trehalose 6-phosphate synthase